jgi:hypothetical protein
MALSLDPVLAIPHPRPWSDHVVSDFFHASHMLEGHPAPPPPARPPDEPEQSLPLDPYSIVDGAMGDVPPAVDDDAHRQRGLFATGQRWQ